MKVGIEHKTSCVCVYHVCVEQRDPPMLQVLPEAGPDGRDLTLKAPLVFCLHCHSILLEWRHRSAAGVKHLWGGGRSPEDKSINSKLNEVNSITQLNHRLDQVNLNSRVKSVFSSPGPVPVPGPGTGTGPIHPPTHPL